MPGIRYSQKAKRSIGINLDFRYIEFDRVAACLKCQILLLCIKPFIPIAVTLHGKPHISCPPIAVRPRNDSVIHSAVN